MGTVRNRSAALKGNILNSPVEPEVVDSEAIMSAIGYFSVRRLTLATNDAKQ